MKYSAAIFDLDGTLIDSTWVWEKMIEKFCIFFNIDENVDFMNETAHMPPTEFVNFIKNRYSIEKSISYIKDFLLDIAKEYYSKEVPLKKGAKRLLNLMKENSIKMAIATSCFAELTEIVLKKWEVYDLFSCFLYSEELNTNKMSAKNYLKAADEMNVSCELCGVFEDILLPMKKVKELGMGYFAVEDNKRSLEIKKELELNATYYIKDYDKFIDDGHFEKFFSQKVNVM